MAWLVILTMGLLLGGVVSLVRMALCWIPFAGYLLMAPAAFYPSLVPARLMGQMYH